MNQVDREHSAKFTHDTLWHRWLRFIHPGFGACLRCGVPWSQETYHVTWYTQARGCFPLCSDCWLGLATPEARLPYYSIMVHQIHHEPEKWEDVRRAVLAGR